MAPAQIAATVSTRIAEKTRLVTQYFRDSYHPELHYMRGPGPKWHEKHGPTATAATPIDAEFSSLSNAHS
jgi:hypothetical protein